MAVANSFVPADGRILNVVIYPSEFGMERMQREEIEGPPREIFASTANKNEDNVTTLDDVSDASDVSDAEDEEQVKEGLQQATTVKSSTRPSYEVTSLIAYATTTQSLPAHLRT